MTKYQNAINFPSTPSQLSITTSGVLGPNTLDVGGSLAVGAYGGVNTAPKNGAIISGSVGIGLTAPNASALLALSSTTQGFLPPSMTSGQKNAISTPASGLTVYDNTIGSLGVYNGVISAWTAAITQVNIQTFTSNGTYTPTTGMQYCIVEIVGGGGGAGATETTSSTGVSCAAAGGGGGYVRQALSVSTAGSSQAITIGSGGTGGASGNPGNSGGNTSFGSLMTADGGGGGATGGTGAGVAANGGAGGVTTAPSGTSIFITGGAGGCSSFFYFTTLNSVVGAQAGPGGGSPLGLGGGGTYDQATGNAGTGYGGGGGGTTLNTSQTGGTGAAGSGGICIVTEFIA